MNIAGQRVGNDELVRMASARPVVGQDSARTHGCSCAQNGSVRMPLADSATLSSIENVFFLNET